jgi:hypothetical protein
MSTAFLGPMPDLAQRHADLIKAVLDNPDTVIQSREGNDPWSEHLKGAEAIRAVLNPDNWRNRYEFRVRPPGVHGYIKFDPLRPKPLDYKNMYEKLSIPPVEGELVLHVELDPEDPTIVRVCEVLKPTPEEQA